jgi:HEAT repeat protein
MAAHSRDPRLFRALVDLLDSDLDWWIKVPTLETLVTFPHEGIHELLVGKLHDPELGPAAIACLGLLSQPQGLPHLVRLLDSERRGLRRAALRALDNYRDPVLLPTLERVASQDSDEECRVTALEMLDEYGAEGVSIAASIRGQQAAEAPAADEGLTLTMEREDASDAG